MNKRFNSYAELLAEKQRLEVLVKVQREVLHEDIQGLKEHFHRAKEALDFVKRFTTKDKSNLLLNIGSDLAINTIVKKFLLARTGWLTRLVVPYFLKNYSSHFLSEQKDKWLDRLSSWLGHKNGKEKEQSVQEREHWDEEGD